MQCAHCCFSCTAQGEDMSLRTFRRALKLAVEYDDWVVLGGGEPTVHPRFEQFIAEALSLIVCESNITVITNGKHARRALLLAGLARRGVLDAYLSQDEYHDPVDPEVVSTFIQLKRLRRVDTSQLIPEGRALNLLGYEPDEQPYAAWGEPYCTCDEIFVEPSGVIHQCGCVDSPTIGHVSHGLDVPRFVRACWKSREFAELEAEEMST
jgi:hypothetical protein